MGAHGVPGLSTGPLPALPGPCRALALTCQNCGVGVVLTPIIEKETIALADLRGRTLAVDGNGELYQFLALIRLRDGTPLQDSKGRTTSHLSGLFYRTTRLMAEHALRLVFVFDGAPPPLKSQEIAKRRPVKQKIRRGARRVRWRAATWPRPTRKPR